MHDEIFTGRNTAALQIGDIMHWVERTSSIRARYIAEHRAAVAGSNFIIRFIHRHFCDFC